MKRVALLVVLVGCGTSDREGTDPPKDRDAGVAVARDGGSTAGERDAGPDRDGGSTAERDAGVVRDGGVERDGGSARGRRRGSRPAGPGHDDALPDRPGRRRPSDARNVQGPAAPPRGQRRAERHPGRRADRRRVHRHVQRDAGVQLLHHAGGGTARSGDRGRGRDRRLRRRRQRDRTLERPRERRTSLDACIDQKIPNAGLRPDQVRVIYHKAADQFTTGPGGQPLPTYPARDSDYFAFYANLDVFAQRAATMFPSVQAIYTTSRMYGGFTNNPARGEPLSYEEGHALNTWLEDNPSVANVWQGWGPYILGARLRVRRDQRLRRLLRPRRPADGRRAPRDGRARQGRRDDPRALQRARLVPPVTASHISRRPALPDR